MKLKYFSGLPFVIENLNISESENLEIYEKAIKLETETISKNISNVGGFHSEVKNLNEIINVNTFNEIHLIYENYLNQIFFDIKKIDRDKIEMFSWLNINRGTNINTAHEHTPTGSIFSAVYYVEVPVNLKNYEGAFIFEDLMYPHPRNEGNIQQPFYRMPNLTEPTDNNIEYFKMSNKDLIIFPSSLFHSVAPTNTNDLRISLAINIHDPRFKNHETINPRTNPLFIK